MPDHTTKPRWSSRPHAVVTKDDMDIAVQAVAEVVGPRAGLSIEMALLVGAIAAHVDALDCELRRDRSLVEDLVSRVLSEKLERARAA